MNENCKQKTPSLNAKPHNERATPPNRKDSGLASACIFTMPYEEAQDTDTSSLCSCKERSDSIFVGDADVGPGLQQSVRDLQVVTPHGLMQSCASLPADFVHLAFELQDQLHNVQILSFTGYVGEK